MTVLGFLLSGIVAAADPPELHPKCTPLPTDLLGPFVRLGDGGILAIDGDASRISKDEGKTWSEPRPLFAPEQGVKVS